MATDNKYDRQLRLWGANGQKKLSESCIVLVNATAVGTETLKNLCLPGVGKFHIIDDAKLSQSTSSQDPFSNFFVFPDQDSNGTPQDRAETATKHLSELNPDVIGSFTSVDSLETADYKSIFSSLAETGQNLLVIASDLPPSILKKISSICWDGIRSKPVPLVIVKSFGLIGSVRIQTPYHAIIESKPDNEKPDLRLAPTSMNASVFPELAALVEKTNLDQMDSKDHSHVPYVILLLKAMQSWRKNNEKGDDALPKTFAEKEEYRKELKSLARDMNMELNFIEADQNYYLAYTDLEIPFEVQELIDLAQENLAQKIEKKGDVDMFDVLLLALKKFMESHDGFPPLNGSIPDMTASTQGYIELQTIYKSKAESDVQEMKKIIAAIVDEYDTDKSGVIPLVSDDDLNVFCKNIYNLRLIKTRSYCEEYDFEFGDDKDELLSDVAMSTFDPYDDPVHTPILWYIALKACDLFYDEHGHYPGQDDRELALQSDAKNVQKYIVEILSKIRLDDNELVKSTLLSTEEEKDMAFAKEMTRYNNAEIHNIASVIGGVASQEAVKLITGKFIPMDGTYIFNGIVGVAGVIKL